MYINTKENCARGKKYIKHAAITDNPEKALEDINFL